MRYAEEEEGLPFEKRSEKDNSFGEVEAKSFHNPILLLKSQYDTKQSR